MTRNQLAYWQHQETMRSNRANEDERHRSNVVNEGETFRSNVARETETRRHNIAGETHDKNVLAETKRHNKHTEIAGYINSAGNVLRGVGSIAGGAGNLLTAGTETVSKTITEAPVKGSNQMSKSTTTTTTSTRRVR